MHVNIIHDSSYIDATMMQHSLKHYSVAIQYITGLAHIALWAFQYSLPEYVQLPQYCCLLSYRLVYTAHTKCTWQSTLVGKKTAPFYFCSNFVKMTNSEIIIRTCILQEIWNKTTSKSSISLEAYLYSALWNTACVRVFVTNVTLA